MASTTTAPVGPACLRVALCAALILVAALAAPPPASAQGGEPRFDVLVFSRTTGFRHTDAIDAGQAAIAQMGVADNFAVTASEDPTQFTDQGLRPYEVVVFLNTDGEGILNGAQRTAFERWMQRGGGLVGIHAAANADRDWDWHTDMMGGAQFAGHPSGDLQFQTATVNVEDAAHPSTQALPSPWVREDEWYNFTAEPRGKVHVLLTLDESTYEEQDGSPEADDHPIAWCSNYDRGRHFYTALGHHGSYWAEAPYRAHILGAIEWASGEAAGDCGAPREGLPTDASFDKVTLDDNTENPMELAVAADGTVYYVELAGKVKMYDPQTRNVRVIGTIPVHRGNENGLLGIALDSSFETNERLYLFYSAPPQQGATGFQHISRFTLDSTGAIDMASSAPRAAAAPARVRPGTGSRSTRSRCRASTSSGSATPRPAPAGSSSCGSTTRSPVRWSGPPISSPPAPPAARPRRRSKRPTTTRTGCTSSTCSGTAVQATTCSSSTS